MEKVVRQHHHYTLELYRNGVSTMRFPLTSQRVVLGKSPTCDLTLDDVHLLDEHALLLWMHEAWHLRPLGAIQSNGEWLKEETVLSEDQSFELGAWGLHLSATPESERPDARMLKKEEDLPGETKLLDPRDTRVAGPFLLRWTDSDGLPKEFKIRSDRVLIGKSKICDLTFDDEYMSSRHCEVYFDGKSYHLRDMQSTNGSFVNGLRVKDVSLEEGNDIVCGETKIHFLKNERSRRRERHYHWRVPLVGQSRPFQKLAEQIERIAPLAQNVFIHGETGTGKELVAAALHELSARKNGAFLAINCGAISKDLMESELFGHEKGAFTGAQQRRAGAFELANGGTLFLDEIGELPMDLQPKLLRVLETGRFRRLGGRDEISVDVRVFSATHRDLNQAIRMGHFREDLFYRLYVLPVEVPSLRERLDDIPLLVSCFVAQACSRDRSVEVGPEVCRLLQEYQWPGNIRELRNLVYRALAFCDGDFLKREHVAPLLPESVGTSLVSKKGQAQASAGLSPIKQKEREVVVAALKECRGNQSLAAKKLGICRTTLYYKIKEYSIDMRRRVIV